MKADRIRDTFLHFAPPWIGEAEKDEVLAALESDWVTTGPRVERFEEAFAEFLGAPDALALNSCTGALHTALAVLDVGPGDAVVTTPMTFCSSVNVIEHRGARPILVDVEPDTLNLDPGRVARAVEEAEAGGEPVKAIIPVHLYGHPCEMDGILEVARTHGVHVVEDAAHALPASYRGRAVGAPEAFGGEESPGFERLACFSFYATKNLTTGEGGMLTGRPELVDEARLWSLHGMSRDAYKRYGDEGSWYYEVVRPGFKYNMTDIQAAIGLHQLERLPSFQARRREIVDRYDEAFRDLCQVELPARRPEVEHAWHIYAVRLRPDGFRWPDEEDGAPGRVRARFVEEMKARRIGTSVHFIPVHLHPWYRDRYGFRPMDLPVAYQAYLRLVSLPLYPRMSDRDVEDVIRAVRDVVERFGA